jgi:hypothetical protein
MGCAQQVAGKAGQRTLGRVTAIDAPLSRKERRLGFLSGEIQVPEDFDRMGHDEIDAQFGA